jgi:hypothetical protein
MYNTIPNTAGREALQLNFLQLLLDVSLVEKYFLRTKHLSSILSKYIEMVISMNDRMKLYWYNGAIWRIEDERAIRIGGSEFCRNGPDDCRGG